jgi:hypothetical protein
MVMVFSKRLMAAKPSQALPNLAGMGNRVLGINAA